MGHNDQSQIIESLDCEMIVATYVAMCMQGCAFVAVVPRLATYIWVWQLEAKNLATAQIAAAGCSLRLRNEGRRSGAHVAKCAT